MENLGLKLGTRNKNREYKGIKWTYLAHLANQKLTYSILLG